MTLLCLTVAQSNPIRSRKLDDGHAGLEQDNRSHALDWETKCTSTPFSKSKPTLGWKQVQPSNLLKYKPWYPWIQKSSPALLPMGVAVASLSDWLILVVDTEQFDLKH
ncbi:predicted protein [Lichtheimia corymbifera JMRC:FSU:9682]|uniref:Uncharacterized protein n=1 Tax=Lichtheimia corymbifera JMRC:FSU:9682 TaxID=1263082 RepID=A0A068SAP1_9FUNG|nr:predicted protein [Lichtheimia corymbifera JMRC:FSU:9682]